MFRSLVGMVVLAVILAVTPAPSSVGGEWLYGEGVQTLYYGDQVGFLNRSVRAWVAPDGRYRVLVESLDGPDSSEEFVYDGEFQWAFVVPPGAKEASEVTKQRSPRHFAINGYRALSSKIPTETYPEAVRSEHPSGLPERVQIVQDGKRTYDLSMTWSAIAADASVLDPTLGSLDHKG
jgi:hypothetical protein